MKFNIAEPKFRPISITIENANEFDKLLWIIGNVAENRTNHPPQIIEEAKRIVRALNQLQKEQP